MIHDSACVTVFAGATLNALNEGLVGTYDSDSYVTVNTSVIDESLKIWTDSHSVCVEKNDQSSELLQSCETSTRARKLRRPYSPVLLVKKSSFRKQNLTKQEESTEKNERIQAKKKPFVCEKCSSPYVVNPARSRSSAKTYAPRKAFDPETKKVLLVCNACRLSLARSRNIKPHKKHPLPSEEEKSKFVEECANFSANLVEQLKDADASKLYCPVFTLRPCRCLQKYLSEPGEEEQSLRAENLLKILKKAKHLSALKNSFSPVQNPRPRGLLKQKSHMFEDFVQKMRTYLRTQLKLCERACQRVLMYSNNFLHKQLKSAPDQGARIQWLGGSSRQQLCPIAKLPNENCCQERCVMMALTHSRLLEDWRITARRSQRDARRVLAEMLTPSGGTKANCYKFIKMVTGCSHTTISLVNEQMWRTQGSREPPEHGLKRWWRQKSGQSTEGVSDSVCGGVSADDNFDLEYEEEEQGLESRKEDFVLEGDTSSSPRIADIHIPTAHELQELAPADAGRRLLQQRQKLATIQRQLARQQRQLETLRQQRPPIILGCCSGTDLQPVQQPTAVQQSAVLQTVAQPQVVHILEIPATPSVPTASEAGPQQSTLSVLSTSGEFEPISNITVNMAAGQPLGTVFFLPEYETVPSVATDHTAVGTVENKIVVGTSTAETDIIQLRHNQNLRHCASVSAANPATVPAATTQHQQPLHYSPMQFHLPLDIPVQLAVQPSGTEHLPISQSQPIISSQQPFSYSVTQPDASTSSVMPVTLQTTPAAVVNIVDKDNQYIQPSEPPHVYYLETVNCLSSVPD